MSIAIQIFSIITLSIIILTFALVISRIINVSKNVDILIKEIQNLTIEKAKEIELREEVETFSPSKSFGSYEHTNEIGEDVVNEESNLKN